jgi:hypothetical protein
MYTDPTGLLAAPEYSTTQAGRQGLRRFIEHMIECMFISILAHAVIGVVAEAFGSSHQPTLQDLALDAAICVAVSVGPALSAADDAARAAQAAARARAARAQARLDRFAAHARRGQTGRAPNYLINNEAAGATSITEDLRLSTDEILNSMRQSDVGRSVVNAAQNNEIDLVFRPFHPQPQVRGYALDAAQAGRANPTGFVFVENNAVVTSAGINRPATIHRVGEAGVHEGLHALGLEGSWEAELWARRLQFEHVHGRPPTIPEIIPMEWEMIDAGRVYESLPRIVGRQINLGGRTINF